MGKKKSGGGMGSRRRQILQLDDGENNSHSYPSPTWPGGSNPLSGLLSQYIDSDEEPEEEQAPAESAAVPPHSANGDSSVSSGNRMDLEVADFLKEIDAMVPSLEDGAAVRSGTDEHEATSSTSTRAPPSSSTTAGERGVQPDPASLWQECFDESTGYIYYWHTLTNEVTWDCPEEHRLYSEMYESCDSPTSAAAARHKTTNGAAKDRKRPAPAAAPPTSSPKLPNPPTTGQVAAAAATKSACSDDEEKMEPISFYGPSSSNEDSDDDRAADAGPSKSLRPQADDALPQFGPQLPLAANYNNSPERVFTCQFPAEFIPEFHGNDDSPVAATHSLAEHGAADVADTGVERHQFPVNVEPTPGHSLLHLSYLDDTEDEPDSTTRTKDGKQTPQPSSLFIGASAPQVLPTADELDSERNNEEDNEMLSAAMQPLITSSAPAFPSAAYDNDSVAVVVSTAHHRGFGFPRQPAGTADSSGHKKEGRKRKKSLISFVKSAETLDLSELNQATAASFLQLPPPPPPPAPPSPSPPPLPASVEPPTSSSAAEEENSDIDDIDEIDRELDLALERKRSEVEERHTAAAPPENAAEARSQTSVIEELSASILSRLGKAGISSDSVPLLQTAFVQLKTRLEDWRQGALGTAYLLSCLNRTDVSVRQTVAKMAIPTHRDSRSGAKRLCAGRATAVGEPDTTRHSAAADRAAASSSSADSAHASVSGAGYSVSSSTGSKRTRPTNASTPQPPPTPPPPTSVLPPPPPPDSTEVDMSEVIDMEVDDATSPIHIASNAAEQMAVSLNDKSSEATSVLERPPVIARRPVPSAADNLQTELSSFYCDLTTLTTEPQLAHSPTVTAAAPPEPTIPPATAAVASTTAAKHSTPARKEKKLKKAKMAPGLVLKKKNIPSLVEKWRKIKREQAWGNSSSEDESEQPSSAPD